MYPINVFVMHMLSLPSNLMNMLILLVCSNYGEVLRERQYAEYAAVQRGSHVITI